MDVLPVFGQPAMFGGQDVAKVTPLKVIDPFKK
jgi:hypothetical protein